MLEMLFCVAQKYGKISGALAFSGDGEVGDLKLET